MFRQLGTTVVAFHLISGAFCSPLANGSASVIEVIPGKGMPSLKSLGLTSAELFRPDFLG
jgi:hypothetical protein